MNQQNNRQFQPQAGGPPGNAPRPFSGCGGRGGPHGRDGSRRREPRPMRREEFKDKVIDLRRVTRVVAGGKRFRFRVTVVIGDERGRIGVGVAKGLDVQKAVEKAKTEAKKKILFVNLKDNRTIPHEVKAKYSAAIVLIKPAVAGHGLKAGGAVRSVLALAGVRDATAKCLGRTPNKLTNALATIEALKKFKSEVRNVKAEIN